MIATAIERTAGIVAAASLKSFLIFAVAGLIVTLWRRSSASTRHLVWTAAVSGAIALPLLAVLMPQWRSSSVAISIPELSVAALDAVGSQSPDVKRQSVPDIALDASSTAAQPTLIRRGIGASHSRNSPSPINAGMQHDISSTSAPNALSPESPMSAATSNAGPSASQRAALAVALRDIGWPGVAALVWLVGFVLALLPFCIGRLRLRRIASTARPVASGKWADLLERTRADAGIRRSVTLLESDDAAMPMTWGVFSPILLLPAAADEWPEWKCRNILLHEMAHVERFDCLSQFVAQLACAMYWFNPLAWEAARRMRVERELACDDRVIGYGSRPSEYASHLLDVALSLRPARATAHAAIAMARPSQLSGRLSALLDRDRNRQKVSLKFRAAVAAITVGVLLPVASFSPWVAQATAAIAPPAASAASLTAIVKTLQSPYAAPHGFLPIVKAVQSSDAALGLTVTIPPATERATSCWESTSDRSTSVHINDDSGSKRTTVKFSSGDCTLELRAEGNFTLRPDLSDVASLDRGGLVTVEERDGGTTRRMEIRSTDGGLEHLYSVNGRRAEYSPEARAWLANILLAVERRTAFAAATRVPQIFESRGARGVLDEVSLMPSDYAKSAYLTVLLKQGINLDAPTLTRIVQQSAREMKSDYYLAEVFNRVGTQKFTDAGTWRAFADGGGGMKSDFYKSQVISKVLTRDNLDAATIATLLRASATIDSDYYQAETLKTMARKYAVTAQTRPYYVAALGRIKSDHYRQEVLSFLNTGETLDPATTSAVLRSISDMKSDYYKSEALAKLAKRGRLDAAARADYFTAVRSITSDYYKHQVLNAALAERPLTREMVAGILAVAPTLQSDYELSGLLTELVRVYTIDDSLRPAYDRAVDSIESDYYRGAALSAARRTSTSR
jgi:beta-lactamase regulating signal transducer with metallopeptidase domain